MGSQRGGREVQSTADTCPNVRTDAADVLRTVRGTEAEVLIQAVADIIPCRKKRGKWGGVGRGLGTERKSAWSERWAKGEERRRGGRDERRAVENHRLLAGAGERVLEGVRDSALA